MPFFNVLFEKLITTYYSLYKYLKHFEMCYLSNVELKEKHFVLNAIEIYKLNSNLNFS